MKSSAPKLYDRVDYDFRPESFWVVADPLAAILRNIKGRRRREMIGDYYAAGKLDELCNELLNDSLDEEARRSLGQIHPTFMGGEYLPNYRRHEVEIARIELQSTTSDVISLRARGSGLRIKYRLVDEYQTESLMSGTPFEKRYRAKGSNETLPSKGFRGADDFLAGQCSNCLVCTDHSGAQRRQRD